MTAFFATALCAGAAVSGALFAIALVLLAVGQPVGALVCALSAGAAQYGVCLAIGWKVYIDVFKGK